MTQRQRRNLIDWTIGTILAIFLAGIFVVVPLERVEAQTNAKVVAVCGAQAYTVGTTIVQTQDTTGKLCSSAASSGTVTVSGTVTANQGTAGSAWPVSQSGTWNVTNVSGTVSLPTGAATSAAQTTAQASLTSIDSKLTSPLTVTGPLTDVQLRASAVPTTATLQAGSANIGAVNFTGQSFANVTTNATTVVKSGAGVLRSICVNTKGSASNIVTAYDNTSGSGTTIATIDTSANVGCLVYDAAFSTGLTLVTAVGTPGDLTVTYR